MGQFTVGEVVLGFFPFSDIVLTGQAKKRPCLVVAHEERGDIVIAQITSKPFESRHAIKLSPSDFDKGELPVISYLRPDKLFTTDPILIERKIGALKNSKLTDVLKAIQSLFEPVSVKRKLGNG